MLQLHFLYYLIFFRLIFYAFQIHFFYSDFQPYLFYLFSYLITIQFSFLFFLKFYRLPVLFYHQKSAFLLNFRQIFFPAPKNPLYHQDLLHSIHSDFLIAFFQIQIFSSQNDSAHSFLLTPR